jgi:hypothetical protein
VDGVGVRLLASLRRCAPVKVRVYDAQDESRDVAVPTRRKRWSQVVETIEARPWVRVEMLDKAGAVLGYVENDGPAEELEDLDADRRGGGMFRERALMEMLIKAQRMALEFRDKEHTTLLQNVSVILQTNANVMQETIAIMRLQRDEAVSIAEVRAEAAAGGDLGEVVKLIEASPKLMQSFGPLIAAFLRPKQIAARATEPNGAKPNGAKS